MSKPADHQTIEWAALNRQRGLLIEKDITGALSAPESRLLAALQEYASAYLEALYPRPEPPPPATGAASSPGRDDPETMSEEQP